MEVIRVARQDDPSLQELIDVIRMDPAIARRIVKFANSPLFGFRRNTATIDAAVVMLGTTMIRTLVLGFSLASKGTPSDSLRPHFQQMWRESLTQAVTAELLGERTDGADPAVWFLAGLLQDVGRLVMLNFFQQEYVDNILLNKDDVHLCELESWNFGFSHADLSADLCRFWNLNTELVNAVGQHHRVPTGSTATLDSGLYSAAACCDYLEAVVGLPTATRKTVEAERIGRFDCRSDEVIQILADADSRAQSIAVVLNADVGNVPPREKILERAQTALMDIAVAEHLQRINDSSDPVAVDQAIDVSESKWIDHESGAFAESLLDVMLPDEIAECSATLKTLGLLSVTLQAADANCGAETLRESVGIIRQCIRPGDRVARRGESRLIVMLQELSINMLAKVSRRIEEQAADDLEQLGVTATTGGLMIVPAGRKLASLKSVLSGLERSQQTSSHCEHREFQVLQGRKLETVAVNP